VTSDRWISPTTRTLSCPSPRTVTGEDGALRRRQRQHSATQREPAQARRSSTCSRAASRSSSPTACVAHAAWSDSNDHKPTARTAPHCGRKQPAIAPVWPPARRCSPRHLACILPTLQHPPFSTMRRMDFVRGFAPLFRNASHEARLCTSQTGMGQRGGGQPGSSRGECKSATAPPSRARPSRRRRRRSPPSPRRVLGEISLRGRLGLDAGATAPRAGHRRQRTDASRGGGR
jgi:hypothetical protein